MQNIEELTDLIRSSGRILVFTGAGISTGSGIPDYRGPEGVWTRRQPVYYQDFMTRESARIEYWEYKLEGWEQFRTAQPNAVHRAIAELEQANKLLLAVTQNVDGLHAKAGTSPELLVELHGSNLEVECQGCGLRTAPDDPYRSFAQTRVPPLCAACGGFLKPATISFGQQLRESDLKRSASAAQSADLVVALGSTLAVQPACSIPLIAAQRGTPYVVINRGGTDHDTLPLVSLRLEGDVAELFPPAVARALANLPLVK